MSTHQLRRDIDMLKRVITPEPVDKRGWFLDIDGAKSTLAPQEKEIAHEAIRIFMEKRHLARHLQQCELRDLRLDQAPFTTDDQAVFQAHTVLFQRHAISPVEKSRRYPIH